MDPDGTMSLLPSQSRERVPIPVRDVQHPVPQLLPAVPRGLPDLEPERQLDRVHGRVHGRRDHAGAAGDRVTRAWTPRRVLRRRGPAAREAAGRGRLRGGVERRGHVAHPARHLSARRPAHDRRRRRARGGGVRALGRRREVRRHPASRRREGRRRWWHDG